MLGNPAACSAPETAAGGISINLGRLRRPPAAGVGVAEVPDGSDALSTSHPGDIGRRRAVDGDITDCQRALPSLY